MVIFRNNQKVVVSQVIGGNKLSFNGSLNKTGQHANMKVIYLSILSLKHMDADDQAYFLPTFNYSIHKESLSECVLRPLIDISSATLAHLLNTVKYCYNHLVFIVCVCHLKHHPSDN